MIRAEATEKPMKRKQKKVKKQYFLFMQLRYGNCTPYVIVLFITIITVVISMMK